MMPNGKIELDPNHTAYRAGRISIRSALYPLLWIAAVVPIVCFFFGWLAGYGTLMRVVLVFVGVFPIVFTIIAYAYFAVRDPGRLQAQTYRMPPRHS